MITPHLMKLKNNIGFVNKILEKEYKKIYLLHIKADIVCGYT